MTVNKPLEHINVSFEYSLGEEKFTSAERLIPWKGQRKFIKNFIALTRILVPKYTKGIARCPYCTTTLGRDTFVQEITQGGKTYIWNQDIEHRILHHNEKPQADFIEVVMGEAVKLKKKFKGLYVSDAKELIDYIERTLEERIICNYKEKYHQSILDIKAEIITLIKSKCSNPRDLE